MAFRYLNVAHSSGYNNSSKKSEEKETWEPKVYDKAWKPHIEKTKQLLSELEIIDKNNLTNKEQAKAYGIIVEWLLEPLPSEERRQATWKLSSCIPSYFFSVIEDIVRNCV